MTGPDLHDAARAVGEDVPFQRRNWRFQRIGWGVMAGIVLLGLIGGLGNGPVASATARPESGGFTLDWERVQRAGNEARLVVTLDASAGPELAVRVEGELADAMDLVGVEPIPLRSSRAAGLLHLVTAAAEGRPARMVLRTRSRAPGLISGNVTADGAAVRARILVLP
ncbi:hypothetical protein [Muricoccus radiodurans]|uniref:hypothetical protein n=1 Tax=Muricoccus radiodurans TaxID=2231721 RepID=UPI003CE7CBDF